MNATHMNQTRRNATAKRYPNAADTSYFVHRFADSFLCAASSVGVVTILFFLITMF